MCFAHFLMQQTMLLFARQRRANPHLIWRKKICNMGTAPHKYARSGVDQPLLLADILRFPGEHATHLVLEGVEVAPPLLLARQFRILPEQPDRNVVLVGAVLDDIAGDGARERVALLAQYRLDLLSELLQPASRHSRMDLGDEQLAVTIPAPLWDLAAWASGFLVLKFKYRFL